MSSILLWCSATSLTVLNQCDDRDRIRQSILGAFVLITAVAAFASSLYAFNAISDSLPIATACATLWASLILTLDRFLVSSIRVALNRRGEFGVRPWSVLPRIVLATAIGVIIGIPIELYVFRDEISERLEALSHDARMTATKALEDAIAAACQNHYLSEQEAADAAVRKWEAPLSGTIDNRDSSGFGCGPRCEGYRKQLDLAIKTQKSVQEQTRRCTLNSDSEVRKSDPRLSELGRRLGTVLVRENKKNFKPTLLTQILMLNALRYPTTERKAADLAAKESQQTQDQTKEEEQGKSHIISAATYAIPLLFILFEICPILAKLLAGVSKYDLIIANDLARAAARTREDQVVGNASLEELKKQVEKRQEFLAKERESVNQSFFDLLDCYRDSLLAAGRKWLLSPSANQEISANPSIKAVLAGLVARFEKVLNAGRLQRFEDPAPQLYEIASGKFNASSPVAPSYESDGGVQVTAPIATPKEQQHGDRSSAPSSSPAPPSSGADQQKKKDSHSDVFVKKTIESFAGKMPEYFSAIIQSTIGPPMAALGLVFTSFGAGISGGTVVILLFASLMMIAMLRILFRRRLLTPVPIVGGL